MSKQYHFVVQFDTDTNEFSLDIDTLNAVFHEGVAFDTKEQEWIPNDDFQQEEDYMDKENTLSGWLQHINTEISEEGEN
jgi:hypothetical protein